MSHIQTQIKLVPVLLLGFGGVGRALTRQIIAARSLHASRNQLQLKTLGVGDSAGAYVKPAGISDTELAE